MRSAAAERVLLWIGLFGAPAAWTLQHVVGYAITEAYCSTAGVSVPRDGLTLGVTLAAAAAAVVAEIAAILTMRATRDAGEEPPGSRIHFLATIGVTIGPLFLAMILMSGLGSVSLEACRQS